LYNASVDAAIARRKYLLRDRARLSAAWDQAFPDHDFATGRLHEPRSLASDAWNDPGWTRAALDYHEARGDRDLVVETPKQRLALLRRLLGNNISFERASHELNDRRHRPTPQTVVEAILHAARERGIAALQEPANIERLRRCDVPALAQIDARLAKRKRR
jgi:hypothetical protein